MERRLERVAGGIIGLASLIEEHGRALNSDLVKIGVSLYRMPLEQFRWDDLHDFVMYLDASSSLVSEINPELAGWQGDSKTPMLLAHIADILAGISYGYTLTHLKKGAQKPKRPEQIPRPGVVNSSDKKTFGKGALPINEFNDWWDQIYEESRDGKK